MARLLVKIVMIDQFCAPLLGILIPNLIAITYLLLSLDLHPLKHLDASDKFNRLVQRNRKQLIFKWLIGIIPSNAVHEFVVCILLLRDADGHVGQALFASTI